MFRFLFGALALMAIGALLFGVFGAAAAIGTVLLVPLFFMAKIFLAFLLFGAFFGLVCRKGGRSRYRYRHPMREHPWREQERASREDRFEEWHRMAHAKEEVESWTTGIDGNDENA